MAMSYEHDETIIKRIVDANNSSIALTRATFLSKEIEFFENHVQNQKVLVAGSGMGHDSFKLARFNKEVVGVEISEKMIEMANNRLIKNGLDNIKFEKSDFFNLDFADNFFDISILNMGTIGNFNEENDKIKIIKELSRVAKTFFFDFYKNERSALEKRKVMYIQEGWPDIEIEDSLIVSSGGLESDSFTEDQFTEICNKANVKVKFHDLCDIAIMAEVNKK